MTLGTYLVGNGEMKDSYNGAHHKYRRTDWSTIRCRTNMKNATAQTREKEYDEVTKHFKPVFHHFFLENYHEPAEWFQKRLNYTRSVATGSMVGFVLGLGDRHSQNILIDKQSGEIIHIDLGVAFDQGKALPTPEIVPFRLTRDLVDAMGVTGVEGVFRKCCEETLQVLRTHRSRLITIVEVFIHDPLYTWTLSPVSAQRRQREDDGDRFYEGNARQGDDHVDAERTLLRFKEKLSGYESGQYLNVSGHARQLISSATHPNNLCKMFHGWAPWV
jgi:ataxia telangiectasia mutated family protein